MLTKMIQRLGALALLFAAPNALAQSVTAPAPAPAATTDARPGLWVVKDKDTTIYLFGTVHVLKPGTNWFKGPLKAAFDASGELVTELGDDPDPATIQPLLMKYGVNPTGPTLTEQLPEDKRAAFAKAVADLGLPAQALDRAKPWLAATQIAVMALQKHGYDPQSGAEETLTKAAKAANKPISGLESVEEQFSFFSGLSQEAQIRFLTDGVERIDQIDSEFTKMVGTWARGDAEALGAIMNEALSSSPELAKVLLADRNERWAAWIKTRLEKPGVVFVAVGAGHLAGNDSVQNFLKQHKIKTRRVKN